MYAGSFAWLHFAFTPRPSRRALRDIVSSQKFFVLFFLLATSVFVDVYKEVVVGETDRAGRRIANSLLAVNLGVSFLVSDVVPTASHRRLQRGLGAVMVTVCLYGL